MQTEYARLPRESLRTLVQAAEAHDKYPALSKALADGHEALAESQ